MSAQVSGWVRRANQSRSGSTTAFKSHYGQVLKVVDLGKKYLDNIKSQVTECIRIKLHACSIIIRIILSEVLY